MEVGDRALRNHGQAVCNHHNHRAAADPVGRGDRTEDLTSEISDKNICSENYLKIILGEGQDEEVTLGRRYQVQQHRNC